MKTIAIANHKGGVGKTATTHALGEALAFEHDRRVLLVDNDPQASLTGACGLGDIQSGLAEVLAARDGASLPDIMVDLAPNLSLVPADLALAPVEMQLQTWENPGYRLREALSPVDGNYDVALIDCAPNLGMLTINALAAADAVLVLTQPQAVDLRGVQVFLNAVARVRADLNPELVLLGVLVTFYDNRLNHHRSAVDEMIAAGYPVLDIKVGRSVRVAEAAGMGKSVVTAVPRNPQAENYKLLGAFVHHWLR